MARSTTSSILDNVTGSGRIICQIDVNDVQNGNRLLSTSPINDGESRMKVVGGSIVTDETRAIPGTGTAELLVDEETAEAVLPLVSGSGLSPTAPAQIHVRWSTEDDPTLVDYGVYEVDRVNPSQTAEGIQMSVEVSDGARRIERARFWRPMTIQKNTNYVIAFYALLLDVVSDDIISVTPTTGRTGALSYDVQDDRLVAINEMATATGYRIDWNAQGRGFIDIYPDNDQNDDPIWNFVDGENARIVSATRELTDERTYNGVIAMGEAAGSDKPPVRAEYWDTNPASPTYFDPTNPGESSYGPVPFFYVSQLITTKTQALAAAKARLPKVIGLVEILTFTCLPHPGIMPGDPILVAQPRIGVEGVYIVQAVSMPLAHGRMQVTCRERRVFL